MRFPTLFLILAICPIVAAQAPAPHPIDEPEARKNFIDHADPIYPPIAKAARVQGTVEINVVIDPSGKVIETRVLSGPPMLLQAALDAVRKWTFKPFLMNGKPAPVTATFEIPFQIDKPGEGPTKEQEEAAQALFPVSDKCLGALKSKDLDNAMTYCKQAVDLAIKAGETNSSDQLSLMLSHQYYGHALILAQRFQDALSEESIAVDEAKRWLTDKDEEAAIPYFWRAIAEANLGLADATFADLNTSEQIQRRAIVNLPDLKKSYSETLASTLRQHAMLLEQVGRADEAAKLRAEADSLK